MSIKPKAIKVKVIGCGGIGGALLPILCRYLNFSQEQYSSVELTLIDGDAYEAKNAARQTFASEVNKAKGTSDLMSPLFPRIYFRSQGAYITPDNAVTLIREGDIVFSCVDNHATRKLLSDRCSELDQVVLISGGNGYTDGNVQVHVRENGQDVTLPIANDFHPEICDPTDENPGEKPPVEAGCEALVESAPQLLITNNLVAASMLSVFYAQQMGKLDYDEVYLDAMSSQSRNVKRKRKETVNA